jgi:DNA-damage-inducible protein D
MLIERGVKSESLPPAEDVRKVERKLNADKRKLLKDVKNRK